MLGRVCHTYFTINQSLDEAAAAAGKKLGLINFDDTSSSSTTYIFVSVLGFYYPILCQYTWSVSG